LWGTVIINLKKKFVNAYVDFFIVFCLELFENINYTVVAAQMQFVFCRAANSSPGYPLNFQCLFCQYTLNSMVPKASNPFKILQDAIIGNCGIVKL